MDLVIYSRLKKTLFLPVPVFTNHLVRPFGIDSVEHLHPVYHLIFITAGEGVYTGASEYPIKTGDIVVVDPDTRHVFSARSKTLNYFAFTFYLIPVERFIQDLSGDIAGIRNDRVLLDALAVRSTLTDIFDIPAGVVHLGERRHAVIRTIDRYYSGIAPFIKDIEVNDYIGDYFTAERYRTYLRLSTMFLADSTALITPAASEGYSKSTAIIRKITDALASSVHEKYSLSRLAETLNYTPQHLSASFRKSTGMSIGAYAMKLKIRAACDHLRESDMDITEIAQVLSFSSTQHFSAAFKKEKGTTPRKYRLSME